MASTVTATALICLASVSSLPTSDAMSCSIAGSEGWATAADSDSNSPDIDPYSNR